MTPLRHTPECWYRPNADGWRCAAGCAWPLVRAIENEGANPEYHRAMLARHRAEWPELWETIARILAAPHA